MLVAIVLLLQVPSTCLSTSDSPILTFPDENSRFWPAGDPSHFGIASNTAKLGEVPDLPRRPTSTFKTQNGRGVAVFHDVLEYKVVVALLNYIHLFGMWRFHSYDNAASVGNGIPWTATFDADIFSKSETSRHILSLVKSLQWSEWKGVDDLKPYKVVCGLLRRGDIINLHRDSHNNETEFTSLLYLNQLWRKNDYGELLFYDEGDIFATVGPKFNRIVLWDSSIDYLTRPPGMAFKQSQLILMVHYTKNQSKVQLYEDTRIQNLQESRKAVSELFPNMNKPVRDDLDIGRFLKEKYVTKNGKKIFVFDGLFSLDDLDKLRMFTVQHGNYYFDDSIDSDSDNVQWIAAYNIDDFVQSGLWNITRKVAKYVSGKDKWFPYDISCNIIRAYDHTRIHEDCEKQEDEWKFLLYLTPNWTENYYGETVFRETNQDDSEYVASVLPRYGRVVIFQGIIPHSARPPSTTFKGARLSFAVKLSINPWVARVKTMKQEFTHEESMHHMMFSLFKNYNDADFEARHKKELVHSSQESMQQEREQTMRYLKNLDTMGFDDGNGEDNAENDENDGDLDEEFEFEDSYPHSEDEFPEIVERKNYIYGFFKSLNRDVNALTEHNKQLIKDSEVMKERYAKELAKLI